MLRLRLRPVTGPAALVAALVALSFAAWLAAFQEPDYGMAIRGAQCQRLAPDGAVVMAERSVALPFATPVEERYSGNITHCRFELDLTAAQVQDAALLIPSFTDAVTVRVNGQQVAVTEIYRMRNLRYATMPAFVRLSPGVLKEGVNRFTMTLSALPGRTVSLDRVFVGETYELRPYFHARWFASAVLPTLVVGGQMALAIVFALIWAARRRQTEFGWLAATLALAAGRGTVLMPDFWFFRSDLPVWNMLVIWEVTTALMFCRAVARAPGSRWIWLFGVPPATLMLLYMFAPLPMISGFLVQAGIAVILGYLLVAIWALARTAMRGNRDALLILLGLLVLVAFVARDVISVLSPEPTRVFLARSVYSGFLIAVATLMTARFVGAMRELDNTAETLRERIETVEAELRDTYEELRARREAEAVDRERGRLMRDLHDGLGGGLATMLALADAPRPRAREIAHHARAALADMRLIIGSLEDYGGDLPLALGAWRERAEPQLRGAGLRLVWAVRDVPQIAGLGPAQVLDILRIVQEAATNVIKHAHASRVTIETFETDAGIGLAIRDDGKAFSPGGGGRGIGNMRMRAARLSAELTIRRREEETCVLLILPRTFADAV